MVRTKIGGKVPQQIDLMLAESLYKIAHQPEFGVKRKHEAAVHGGTWQHRVAIVAANEKVETLAHNPAFRLNARQALPSERSPRLDLIAAIYQERIMRPGAAKSIALGIFANI